MEGNERDNKIKELVANVANNKVDDKEEITDTFDTKLTACPGDYMYFVDIRPEKPIIDTDVKLFAKPENMKVIKVQILKLMYDSGSNMVILVGKDLYGKQYKTAQEYFFESQKLAKEAIDRLCEDYEKNRDSKSYDVFDVFDREIKIKYRYTIEFLLKPYDIVLTRNKHFTVEAIEFFLDIDERTTFGFRPASDILYLKNKKIVDETRFASFEVKRL